MEACRGVRRFSCFAPFNSPEEFISPADAFLARGGARNLYVGLSGIRRRLYINTRVSSPCFEQGERTKGYAGAAVRERIYGFPRGTRRSSTVDYARGGRGEAKGGHKINRHSLSLVESSRALVNIDFPH